MIFITSGACDSHNKEIEIRIGGSSTVYPLFARAADAFKEENTEHRILISQTGSLAGFSALCAEELDLAGASQKFSQEDVPECKDVHRDLIPFTIAIDGVTLVVPSDNNFLYDLSVSELRLLWKKSSQTKITRWSDLRPSLPDIPIRLFAPGTNSATYHTFVRNILREGEEIRNDFISCEDDHVLVQAVQRQPGGLGFFGYGYFQANQEKLRAISISRSDNSTPIAPSALTLANGLYKPLTRFLYIYVHRKSLNQGGSRRFLEFILSQSEGLAQKEGLIPLPPENTSIENIRLQRTLRMLKNTSSGGIST